jgi:D-alanyl-D-alanine dipeptidase
MIAMSQFRAGQAALSLFALAGCSEAAPQCPDVLATARTLIVVTADGMDGPEARLQVFQRPDPSQAWQPAGPPEAAVAGEKGMAWGFPFRHLAREGEAVKTEGDRRTPAGIFALGASFGHEASPYAGHMKLAKGEHVCVDDPGSPNYSRIVPRSVAGEGVHGEEMVDYAVYVRGVVVDYPTSRQSRAGSCIFLHVWEQQGKGTAGCVAAPEPLIARLQAIAAKGDAVVAIVPDRARDRIGRCLP